MVLVQDVQSLNINVLFLMKKTAVLDAWGVTRSCINFWTTPNCADSVAVFSLLLSVTDFLDSMLMRWPFKAHFYAVCPIILAGEGCFPSLIANKETEPYL